MLHQYSSHSSDGMLHCMNIYRSDHLWSGRRKVHCLCYRCNMMWYQHPDMFLDLCCITLIIIVSMITCTFIYVQDSRHQCNSHRRYDSLLHRNSYHRQLGNLHHEDNMQSSNQCWHMFHWGRLYVNDGDKMSLNNTLLCLLLNSMKKCYSICSYLQSSSLEQMQIQW